MEWEEIYEKNRYRKNGTLTNIKSDIILKGKVYNYIIENKYWLLVITLLSIILIAVTFHSNIKLIGLIILLIFMMIISAIYFNTFTITCKKGLITINMYVQQIEIQYKDLKSVYLERTKTTFFFVPMYTYLICLLYKNPNGEISDIKLPAIFLTKELVVNFLDNFEMNKIDHKFIEQNKNYKMKRLLIRLIIALIFLILIIITAFL